jgi:hypothetical protein
MMSEGVVLRRWSISRYASLVGDFSRAGLASSAKAQREPNRSPLAARAYRRWAAALTLYSYLMGDSVQSGPSGFDERPDADLLAGWEILRLGQMWKAQKELVGAATGGDALPLHPPPPLQPLQPSPPLRGERGGCNVTLRRGRYRPLPVTPCNAKAEHFCGFGGYTQNGCVTLVTRILVMVAL